MHDQRVKRDAVLDTKRRFTEAAERLLTGAVDLNLVRGQQAHNLMPVALSVATDVRRAVRRL
jgi:hypothetical protein